MVNEQQRQKRIKDFIESFKIDATNIESSLDKLQQRKRVINEAVDGLDDEKQRIKNKIASAKEDVDPKLRDRDVVPERLADLRQEAILIHQRYNKWKILEASLEAKARRQLGDIAEQTNQARIEKEATSQLKEIIEEFFSLQGERTKNMAEAQREQFKRITDQLVKKIENVTENISEDVMEMSHKQIELIRDLAEQQEDVDEERIRKTTPDIEPSPAKNNNNEQRTTKPNATNNDDDMNGDELHKDKPATPPGTNEEPNTSADQGQDNEDGDEEDWIDDYEDELDL